MTSLCKCLTCRVTRISVYYESELNFLTESFLIKEKHAKYNPDQMWMSWRHIDLSSKLPDSQTILSLYQTSLKWLTVAIWLSWTILGYYGLSWTSMDYHGLFRQLDFRQTDLHCYLLSCYRNWKDRSIFRRKYLLSEILSRRVGNNLHCNFLIKIMISVPCWAKSSSSFPFWSMSEISTILAWWQLYSNLLEYLISMM